jgi:hypothetical protein
MSSDREVDAWDWLERAGVTRAGMHIMATAGLMDVQFT